MTLLVLLAVFLAAYNNLINLFPLPRFAPVPVNLAVAVALLAAAHRGGFSLRELGFARESVGPGLRWGVGIAAGVTLLLGIGLLIPAAQPFFADERVAGIGIGTLLYRVLLRIPLATALFEEVAFRGVLLGVWARHASLRAAVVGSSLIFGLWHIVPTIQLLDANDLAPDPASRTLAVALSVLVTSVAGGLFCLLRLHTRGVLGPTIAHASLNSLATLAAFVAQ